MSKQPTKRSSSILITEFIKQSQNFELDDTKLKSIDDEIKKRRENRPKAGAVKEKKKETVADSVKNAEKFKTMDEHSIPLPELFKRLGTSEETGLTTSAAQKLNQQLGPNALTEKKSTPWYVKLIKEMVSAFAIMLWAGSALCFITYGLSPTDPSNLYLAVVLIIIVLISGFAAFFQNYKSEAIMDTFKNFIPPTAMVKRDGGNFSKTNATQLVPGDIIFIKDGNRIPADIRVINCSEMRVDNSSLTGESEPLLRSPECTNKTNPLETKNLCFFGTLCKEGSCEGVVLNIGDSTIIGQIAHLASSATAAETPLQREMDQFIIIVAAIATIVGVIFFIIGFPLGYDAITNVIFAIGLIVGNAPEGLLITITVSLTLAAKRLAARAVLAKNLQSVETLGSTTTICSDKTGTLTQNRMTIENIWYDGQIMKAINKQKFEKDTYNRGHKTEYDENSIGFKELQKAAVLSSGAKFETGLPEEKEAYLSKIEDLKKREEETIQAKKKWAIELASRDILDRPVNGDASETAIVKFFQAIEDIEATRTRNEVAIVDKYPTRVDFNSTNKFALCIVRSDVKTSGCHYILYMKGAPERIWKLCTHILINGKPEPITSEWKKRYDEANEKFGKSGERVLGFSQLKLDPTTYKPTMEGDKILDYPFNTKVSAKRDNDYKEWNFPLKGQTFVGLVSLIDPPRDSVPYSIKKCKTAGIKVIMVTGDQPVTAAAIARKVNIFDASVKTNVDYEAEGLSVDEAIMRAEAIVIHGDLITEASNEDEILPESERGRKLAYWLSKKQIVFARTSPAQKLIIVSGCQAKNEVVAVTGDGVNDSPAIKKADIGIAMGVTGSDVAKDAADLILLTDDFSALVVGIEEGRRLFDNLKKTISYSLCANIPEVVPFILLIIFKFPLPVTTILLLCVSVGTDMFPAISLAYEEAELDVMVRRPRDRHEHLVSKKLFVFTYAQMGIFEAFGAFVTYFVIMADFGFTMASLFGLGLLSGYQHKSGDVYDQYSPTYGNSNLVGQCTPATPSITYNRGPIDWIFNADDYTDLRMAYVQCDTQNGIVTGGVQSLIPFGACHFKQISQVTHRPVCYSIESVKYAQTGFFCSIMVTQIAALIANKTRRGSVYFQGLKNYYQMFGIAMEIIFALCLAYIPAFWTILSTRDVDFLHFGMPAVSFSLFMFLYDEIRKYLIGRSIAVGEKTGKPGWWYRNYCY